MNSRQSYLRFLFLTALILHTPSTVHNARFNVVCGSRRLIKLYRNSFKQNSGQLTLGTSNLWFIIHTEKNVLTISRMNVVCTRLKSENATDRWKIFSGVHTNTQSTNAHATNCYLHTCRLAPHQFIKNRLTEQKCLPLKSSLHFIHIAFNVRCDIRIRPGSPNLVFTYYLCTFWYICHFFADVRFVFMLARIVVSACMCKRCCHYTAFNIEWFTIVRSSARTVCMYGVTYVLRFPLCQ